MELKYCLLKAITKLHVKPFLTTMQQEKNNSKSAIGIPGHGLNMLFPNLSKKQFTISIFLTLAVISLALFKNLIPLFHLLGSQDKYHNDYN